MKYMGSKARFAKDILPIILKEQTENTLKTLTEAKNKLQG